MSRAPRTSHACREPSRRSPSPRAAAACAGPAQQPRCQAAFAARERRWVVPTLSRRPRGPLALARGRRQLPRPRGLGPAAPAGVLAATPPRLGEAPVAAAREAASWEPPAPAPPLQPIAPVPASAAPVLPQRAARSVGNPRIFLFSFNVLYINHAKCEPI